jgi:RNA polymerase sigma-70 factor (ECF subfamily)
MDIAQSIPLAFDLEAELVASYPLLARRLTIILHDADEAQDVAQAAFARALERRHRFHGGDARAWLYTIGIRLALNEVRRRRRLVSLTDHEEPAWAMESEPDLWLAMARLGLNVRAALVLHVIDGYSHAEIGTMLGVRPGTVASWISRGKDQLRISLGDRS